ncbi:hypothetical protein AB0D65_29235 [Streptomyces griseoloalbus]|uniref:Uncharacterized protein n=1 Tax=Streptomyces griseoloalbus TaxID=67303 RepID=A0ABV3ECT0_9ACTN
MSSHTDKLDIIVGEFPTDAALYNIKGVRTLFMSSAQTFSNAVENVRNVLPGITLEAAERMIREQCPEFKDIDDLLGLNRPAPPSVERPPIEPVDVVKEQFPGKRRRKVVLVAALLPALAASWALGRYTNVADTAPADTAKATAAAPDKAADDAEDDVAPFKEPRFTRFAGASNIDCDPISPLEAECTDADGKVMSTKAATGPDSTIFTFSYGSERIGLRIFYEAAYAETWARQDGTQDLYPHLEVHGRYVLWGTDAARVKEYSDLLVESDRGDVRAMGGREPLPPRLAALTLGTLGLDQGEVHQLLAQSPTAVPADTPAIMAARLVLGMDEAPPTSALDAAPESEDIVALAAGIEPTPSTGGKTTPDTATEPDEAGSTVPVGTGGSGTGTKQPATGTSPSTDAPTEPSTPSTQPSTPPAETKPPAETTKPPTTTDPATPPPPQPEKPPADPAPTEPAEPPPTETPEPPAGETPPPAEETPEPPAEQTPDPAEETPAPVETPAETDHAPPGRTPGEGGDDLLILNSAWTVSAA